MIKTADLTVRQKQIVVAISAILVFYILFGFLGAPFIVRSIMENQVARAINRDVSVGSVRVNPITLSVTLRDLDVRETGGAPFVKWDDATVNLQVSSLFKWALVLKSVRVVNPTLSLVRSGETAFNFSDIAGGDGTGSAPTGTPDDPGGLALAVYETRLTGARVVMDDRVAGVTHHIDDLNLTVSDFSSRPADMDVTTRFHLGARINGATLALDGKTRPFGPERETTLDVGVERLSVPHYLPYAALPENLVVQSLTLETKTEVDFRMLEGGQPELVVAGLISFIDARLADGNGDAFVYHPNLKIDLLPSTVLGGQLRVARMESSGSEYFLKRLHSGALYLPFLAAKAYGKAEEKAAEDTTGGFQPVLTIDAFKLDKGVVHFTDLSNSEPFSTTITDLDVEVDNFGLNSDRTAAYRLSLKSEAGESVTLSGTASPTPLQLAGELDVSGLQVSRYIPYYKDRFDFKTTAGQLSFGGSYRFRQEAGGPLLSLSGVHLDLEHLSVVDEDDDDPLIAFERLRVADATVELARREVTLGRLELSRADFSCRREKDGALNLVKAFVPAFGAHDVESDGAGPSGEKRMSPADPESAPFVVNLGAVSVTDAAVAVEDRVPREPVKIRLDRIALSASDLSTAPGSAGKADFSLRWEQAGQFRAGGAVTISPLALDLAVAAENMDVRPFQPYLSEQAGLIVTQGFFSTQGRLGVSRKPGAAPAVAYTGTAGLNRFASIDRKNANDFLKWEALVFDHFDLGLNPTGISIDQVSLSDFFARLIVDPDGSVNLVSMFSPTDAGSETETGPTDSSPPPPAPIPPAGPRTEKPTVRIARVSLTGGDVDFSDRLIKPNFNARFHDLGGRVSGLESIEERKADVLLEGMWSDHAPVKVTGRINPLIDNPYLDLNLNISDIELSPFSPYSGKYLGYILEKGKLTFNVAYLMEDRRLEGKNSIYVNQLTLGDPVDSPDTVGLPIKLAVALLKDRDGNIELELPVSGNVDDPEFKIGRVVLTVIRNLIVKIVTSPFAALGALAGGGEELSYLDFDSGTSQISRDNADKMDKLAKILYERPGLKLDLQGTASPEWDRDGLRGVLLENRLKAEKLQRMMASGESAVPLEAITVDPAERPVLMAAIFSADGLAVPVDANGKPVVLTPEEIDQLVRTHTRVTENDFRKLADARAFNVKNYLLENGRVARERVFIVAPKAAAEGQNQEKTARGRVVFSLK
ncbi:flagellar motor protein MotB [Desulfosarcina alkanivorans]|uniref:Flagellar motor protein MotB n=1 Tax=Desulfosarcina alkanivorans TaxID=571177 RepID=A0A5K7YSZ2_9BACT|nr:DUF748 domain-containing protein [Desulfosarcina alkanivorans]BBO69384.1 flagellar motor protein MotB [Desulfosarcina alkanivorans]